MIDVSPPPVLLFPGQGSQFPGMGRDLYRRVPGFAAGVDEVFQAMGSVGERYRSAWHGDDTGLDEACLDQATLFTVDYALGRLVVEAGLRPVAVLGHSVGELAAAVLAGVFDLGDATRILLHRVDLLAHAPAGGMVAVGGTVAEVSAHLGHEVDIGAINAPRQTVISGPTQALRATVESLRAMGLLCVPVPATVAFHSRVLVPVVEAALPILATVPARAPRIPMTSCYTAAPLTEAEAVSGTFWARQPVDPVLFWPALDSVLADGPRLLVECGPGQGLTTVAKRHPHVRNGQSRTIALLPRSGSAPGEETTGFVAAASRMGLPVPTDDPFRRGPATVPRPGANHARNP